MLPPPSVVDGWISARRRARQVRGHLIFTGSRDRAGYGTIHTRAGVRRVHELAVEVREGRVLKTGEYACHRCAEKACFAPSHVYRGDARTNAADRRRERGR